MPRRRYGACMRARADLRWVLPAISACAIGESPRPAAAPSDPPTAFATAPIEVPSTEVAPIEVEAAPVHAEDLPPLLREIAASYERWHLVDEVPNPAGVDCTVGFLGGPHLSGSDPASAHVDKVFYLYAFDVAAYWRSVGARPERGPEPSAIDPLIWAAGVRQVLVKESFTPRRLEHSFRAGKPTGLFVMAQFEGAPAGTDDGWIYGTISPSGRVTSAGVIDKCVGCHAQQPDRVFGLPTRGD